MSQVEITINGRQYRVACEDGQESHLTNLANYFDGKMKSLVEEVGQIGDTHNKIDILFHYEQVVHLFLPSPFRIQDLSCLLLP